MRKKRVLLLSEGFGSGHTQAAYALAAGLRQLDPAIHAKVIELGKFLNPVIGPLIISAYRRTVSKQPKIVGLMYRSNYNKSLNRFTQLALHRVFYTETSQVIRQLQPEAIVCTHPVPNAVVARLKRLGLQIPLYTVITDYDAHSSWISPQVTKYFVSTKLVRQRLINKGVASEQIIVSGIPVHPDFWELRSSDEARALLGLKKMPTVLIMGGGWGLMYEGSMLEHLIDWKENTQLIFCMGSNEKIREAMLSDPRFQHPNIHILGYTKEIHRLMDVADLLITKPGGMTCTEGMSKGLPMLFYEPIPGQEEENCQYFVDNGLGELLDSRETADRWISSIHESEKNDNFRHALLAKRNLSYDATNCPRELLQLLSLTSNQSV